MTAAEKSARVQEMQMTAQALKSEKMQATGLTDKDLATGRKEQDNGEKKDGAKFLNQMKKDVYIDSNMNLEERINRNKHYRQRDANRDD